MDGVNREVLKAVLRLTKNGPIDYTLVSKSARIPAQVANYSLRKLERNRLIYLRKRVLAVSSKQRIEVAILALKSGSDFESICRQLKWKEFEEVSMRAFEAHNYVVKKNFRFSHREKRWEIDLVACRKPIIVSADCKHWKRNWSRAAIVNFVERQTERTKSFADALPKLWIKLELGYWQYAKVIPIILSLQSSPFKFHHDTPIVSILQLQSFLTNMHAEIDCLTHFYKTLEPHRKQLTEYHQNDL